MPPVDLLQNNTMKQIIRMCAEHNLDLKAEVRKYVKALPNIRTILFNG
jgi:hypothetical protein